MNIEFFFYYRLPVDGPNGEPVIAEAIVSGKKKEAVLQCALEGCRILDRMNLLRASTHGKYVFRPYEFVTTLYTW